ncbi:prepilin-type N-terminal cleavage/methylation domain-containing protein [Fimbriimonas ginsengisoli]|uniref:Uncharacterized protein n=1 Tax=Fimbriimonas ginsengisoli Gsoil 348 TaxID=661478 RepID=A0A068NW59_FIMGI|nr:prepilin-type N-terminal cleavage/methylation domain-containing protein [Fimbriimonas ginsengisoli]AIE87567.1 hypothetical protein OP10G_4199 [Fimbriimonas ginsengisoli Gsoil 348]
MAKSRRGFTLIEVSVVITIIVVLAALVTPNLSNMLASRQVRTFVNALPDIAGQTRDAARNQGVTTKLTYDDSAHQLIASIERVNQDDETITSLAVPNPVQIQAFQADGQQKSAGDWTLHFYSDGHSDGGGVETNDAGMLRSLVVDRNGVATLVRGPLPDATEERWPAGDYEHRTTTN